MKKGIWFYLCIVQAAVILIGLCAVAWSCWAEPEARETDLVEYLGQFSEENNYLPDAGYIPDAKTAKAVCEPIIDKMTGSKFFGGVTIEYDEENRLWRVEKWYLFGRGGFVLIEQDSGKILKALLTKK